MKRLVVVLAAVSMTVFLARCGGGGPEGPDASAPTGNDAAHATGDGGTQPAGDGSTVQPAGDGSTVQPGSDGSTTQPGDDASTTQPGADGSTVQPGQDGSTIQPGTDASTTQPGQDASTTLPNDGGTPGTCDPFAQTGCSGQKCSLDQTGAFVCVAAGAKTDQQDCTQESDCAAGLACVQINGEAAPKCRAFCNASKKCVTGQACIVGAVGGTSAILCAVVPACDPWAQTGCNSGQKCTLADTTPTFTCGAAGSKGDLATCANDGECQAGLVCLDFGDGSKCHALCGTAKACATGQSCLGGSSTSTDPFVCLPTPACNPLTQDCPNSNEGCFPKSQTEWACFQSVGKQPGAACTYSNDCIKGYVCAGSASGTCMQICDPAGVAPLCTAPKTCAGFITPAGVCN
ncbi:MAG TPA: hypothetical protein VGK67_07075 [Myxococcales bacterium]|jgi:hypothetical protein